MLVGLFFVFVGIYDPLVYGKLIYFSFFFLSIMKIKAVADRIKP